MLGLSDPVIKINNENVSYVPHSVSYKESVGTFPSTSIIKFSLDVTDENIILARKWLSNNYDNSIVIEGDGHGKSSTMRQIAKGLLTQYFVEFKHEGCLLLEFIDIYSLRNFSYITDKGDICHKV